jgi:uncharacterized membrane protein (UPF0127 family)
MIVIHKKSNRTIASDVKYADTMISRMVGLMFVKEIKGMDGLLLDPCNSIHNCFVRFPIDVVFLDKENKVVKIIRGFKPWRFTRIYFKAKRVLELPSGKLLEGIENGDELEVRGV